MKIKFQLIALLVLYGLGIKINAQIYYQDIVPDKVLNNFGVVNIHIDSSSASILTYGASGNLSVWNEGGSQINIKAFSNCEVLMNGVYPAALNINQPIASTGTWVLPNYAILSNINGTQGNWIGVTDKYIGVRYKNDGALWIYGWIRMDVNIVGSSLTVGIKDYACNRTPNASINAGQVTLKTNDLNVLENLISVYPNPSDGFITINTNEINSNINLQIINVQGKVICNERVFNDSRSYKQDIDLSKYSKGIYFVKFTNKNFTKVEKIVLQ